MPLLTKKFTRDSLKRASGGGAGIPNESEDQTKAEMIQREMARARTKSMRNRNILNQQQRRNRSLSKGPSSPYRSFGLEESFQSKTDSGGPKPINLSHPNDEYSQAYNEAELLTQMSSLTEPTWAPSVVGGSDINSTHRRHNHQNQRNRTGNYNNVRHQTRFQHSNAKGRQSRATITISTAKDHKETKVLLLDDREKEKTTVGHNKSNNNHGHHERASVGIEGIEIHRIERDERREDEEYHKTVATNTKCLQKNNESSDMRDDVPEDDAVLSASKTKHSLSSRRSKTGREGDESNASRTRGRSGRPSSNRKNKKRSSSISSQRSVQSARTESTAPTISKYSSTSSSFSAYVTPRRSKTDTSIVARRRRTSCGKEKLSSIMRSSSVPPSTSNSKHNQRRSSMPPKTFKMTEMQRIRSNGRDNSNVLTTRINQYGDAYEHEQSSKTNTQPNNDAMESTLNTASTMADTTTASSQSNSPSRVSFASGSQSSVMSSVDCLLTPSSNVEAARISLKSRLHRSNSNRSISSVRSESIYSTTSNRRVTSTEKALKKLQALPSVAPASPSKTAHFSRTHKLAQDVRAKKILEQRQQRRHELEMEQKRRQEKEEERPRKEERVAALKIESDGGEPHPTTVTTLVFDFLLFHLLLLFTFPHRAVLRLWNRTFSKKWTAHRKNVLVTGANSALGSETARRFAAEGANLILISHSTESLDNGLNWLVKECHELGSGKIRSFSADLSNAISTELTLRQAAKDFNDTFDVVILNGENKSHGCLFEEILDVHQIEKMVTENTLGCIMALHYSLKHVPKSSDSRIVILSSTSGLVASPYRSVYGATQHALKGFCDSIRLELNKTYTERRAPKVCFASFPELVGQNIHNRDSLDQQMSRMGADFTPMKTRSWAGMPIQQAVHDLLGAITSGEREFGAPQYVNAWRFVQVLAPGLVDFSIFRHSRKTQYRPLESNTDALLGIKGSKNNGASVSNKIWD